MKAIVYDNYGSPDELRLEEIPTPVPGDDQIRIKIAAVSINGADKEGLIGKPLYSRMSGLRRPGSRILGSDIAGRVDAVGKNQTEFKVGDEIFGEIPGYHGGFAEYICTHGRTMLLKPESLTFEQAAAIPQGGVIAYQGICEKGNLQAGQEVLINGAGGSAGCYALQLAKLAGAEITGVDNAHKADFMRSLGADHVVDYTKQNFTRLGKRYDLILDLIAYRSAFSYKRVIKPKGQYFVVGGSVNTLLQVVLLGPLLKGAEDQKMNLLADPQSRKGLIPVTELCESGQIRPIIDKVYSFDEVPDAMGYINAGLAKGKVVITLE